LAFIIVEHIPFFSPIPVCAFWMIFGGTKYPEEGGLSKSDNVTVPGFEKFNDAMFSMWRMTLVDEYSYEVSTFTIRSA